MTETDGLSINNGVVCVKFSCGYEFPWTQPYENGVFGIAINQHNQECEKCCKRVTSKGVKK
jgi:hypothetical protein